MINQDYILLILNCKKYSKKAKFQKLTWLPKIPSNIVYYHVIGEPNLDVNYKFDNENNILFIKVDDDYNSLPKKVIKAYNAVNETFNYKYIFKTDDDQVLVNQNFFSVIINITNQKPKIHYGGYIVDIKENYLSQYNKLHPELPHFLPLLKTRYCSGRFYFLSKQAIVDLLTKSDKIEKEYLEDYAIGYNLNQLYKSNMVNIMTNKFFTDIELSDFPKMLKEGKI